MVTMAMRRPAVQMTLRHNFFWMLPARILFAAAQWLCVVVILRLGSAELLGKYSLALAFITPIIVFSKLELRYALCTDAKRAFSFAHYFGFRLLSSALALLIIFCASSFSHDASTTILISAIALAKAFEAQSDIIYGLLQREQRMKRMAISLVITAFLQLSLLSLLLVFTASLLAGVIGMAIGSALAFAVYDLRSVQDVRRTTSGDDGADTRASPVAAMLTWNLRTLRSLFWIGLPLGVVTGLSALSGNVPRYLIAAHLNERSLGLFVALCYLTMPGAMVVSSAAETAIPRLAQFYAGGELGRCLLLLGKLVLLAMGISVAGLLCVLLAGKQIITIVYGSEYADHQRLLCWLMGASIASNLDGVLGSGVTSMRLFHHQVPFRVIQLGITFGIWSYYIPKEGLLGSGKAMLLSSLSSVVLMVILILLCLKFATRNTRPDSSAA
jgi:Membrane protein involved in the export of O-antigen and teichoic acid